MDGLAAMGAAVPQTGRGKDRGREAEGPSGTRSEPGLSQPTVQPGPEASPPEPELQPGISCPWLYMDFLCYHLGDLVSSIQPAHPSVASFLRPPGQPAVS